MVGNLKFGFFKKMFYDQKYVIFVLYLFVFLFEFAWVWILFKSDLGSFMNNYASYLPQSITNMIGFQAGSGMLTTQMMSFGYAHPLIMISMAFLPISLPARYIAGEIENRTFDIILTKPVSRWLIPFQLYLFISLSLVILNLGLFLGTWLGNIIFSVELSMFTYFKISMIGYAFYLNMAAIGMAVACWSQEKGKMLAWMIAIVVIFYFFDVIIRMLPEWDYLTAYSYFQLYQPTQLTLGNASFVKSGFISGLIVILFFITSLVQFNRRDL
ncbi:MAG: ABC transporter permease subunit [Calditrichaceae bacterium]